ncbi:uncharacterized protein EI97DRAFT_475841 [Westerdykella ornata]|uniref:BTB domain-containing protein n=1 Tax=Westerdykella ornata TaxID=318751 RepID=A0A6A6JGK7_WESOR|nr:uncharacterized protein EI97DRAFT_475841 [Westerdykella ornata]KAF2275243.1 hypothetical protein EI97DRAFT_475841 [Westerdykella ornata]
MADPYVVNPFADTIIFLKNPTVEFAVWESHDTQLDRGAQNGNDGDGSDIHEDKDEGPDSKESVDSLINCTDSSNLHDQSSPMIEYHVSSSHLILASKVFSVKASPRWGQDKQADGKYHHTAEGWDPEAFLILMQILHLKHSKLPAKVTLDMMAKLAVLADFYECEEAVEVLIQKWIKALRQESGLPAEYCRDMVLWICIARVFGLTDVFAHCIRTTMYTVREPIQTLGLPMWDLDIKLLTSYKKLAQDALMIELAKKIRKYRSPSYICPQEYGEFSNRCRRHLLRAFSKAWEYVVAAYPDLKPDITFEEYWALSSQHKGAAALLKTSLKTVEDRLHDLMNDPKFQQPKCDPAHDPTHARCNFKHQLKSTLPFIKKALRPCDLQQKHTSTPLHGPDNASERRFLDVAGGELVSRTVTFLSQELRVSSRHLTLASPIIREDFTKHISTGQTCSSPKYDLEVRWYDEDRFHTFMNVLHLRNWKVPKTLSLADIAAVGGLVRKYDCAEAFSEWGSMWIMALPPLRSDKELSTLALLGRVHAAWLFQLPDVSKIKTLEAVRMSRGTETEIKNFRPLARVLLKVHTMRRAAIRKIADDILSLPSAQALKERKCAKGVKTSLECALEVLGLQHDPSTGPHTALRLQDLYDRVQQEPSPDSCCLAQLLGVKDVVERVWAQPPQPELHPSVQTLLSEYRNRSAWDRTSVRH